jgi:hypothetical protein
LTTGTVEANIRMLKEFEDRPMTSAFVKVRLHRFYEAASDPEIGYKRAVKGLKAWEHSNSHRLTRKDLLLLASAVEDLA